jgi:hypothetical protein
VSTLASISATLIFEAYKDDLHGLVTFLTRFAAETTIPELMTVDFVLLAKYIDEQFAETDQGLTVKELLAKIVSGSA